MLCVARSYSLHAVTGASTGLCLPERWLVRTKGCGLGTPSLNWSSTFASRSGSPKGQPLEGGSFRSGDEPERKDKHLIPSSVVQGPRHIVVESEEGQGEHLHDLFATGHTGVQRRDGLSPLPTTHDTFRSVPPELPVHSRFGGRSTPTPDPVRGVHNEAHLEAHLAGPRGECLGRSPKPMKSGDPAISDLSITQDFQSRL